MTIKMNTHFHKIWICLKNLNKQDDIGLLIYIITYNRNTYNRMAQDYLINYFKLNK